MASPFNCFLRSIPLLKGFTQGYYAYPALYILIRYREDGVFIVRSSSQVAREFPGTVFAPNLSSRRSRKCLRAAAVTHAESLGCRPGQKFKHLGCLQQLIVQGSALRDCISGRKMLPNVMTFHDSSVQILARELARPSLLLLPLSSGFFLLARKSS